MHCSRCQAENADGSTRCGRCGRELIPLEPPDDARDTLDDLGPVAGPTPPSGPSRGTTGPGVPILSPVVLAEGETIGPRYEVVRLLGRGGMGAVYLVHDRELEREVALKFLREGVAHDRVALERFRREVALASQVTHRNVLRVFDIGEARGPPGS